MGQGIVPQGPRRRSSARAWMSRFTLIVLVVGAPVALAIIAGSPIPTGGVARLHEVLSSHRVVDVHVITNWVIHGALLLTWAAWIWMVVCVAVEIRSWVTGRSSTRLPASRTMQAVAACLVGTSLALAMMGRTPPSSPAPWLSPVMAGPNTLAAADTLRVVDDEGFELGRWPEVQVDVGDQEGLAVDGAGHVSAASSKGGGFSARILGGDVRLPFDIGPTSPEGAVGSPPSSTAHRAVATTKDMVPADATHIVRHRETLWSIADQRLGSALRWREIAERNYRVTQSDGRMLTKSHWVMPGWKLSLPSDRIPGAAGAVTSSVPDAAGSHSVDGASGTAERAQTRLLNPAGHLTTGVEPSGFQGYRGSMPVAPVGAGLLGAGVVSLLERMRRAQQRHRSDGRHIKLPEPTDTWLEGRLRVGDGRSVVDGVDASLRLFARLFCQREGPSLLVRGVRVCGEEIELVMEDLHDVGPIPGPFELRGERASLFVNRAAVCGFGHGNAGGLSRSNAPCPTLVTVGRGPEGPLLVNLEAMGSMALAGDRDACEGVVRALAVEMATSLWADQFELVLVGFGAELGRFDRVGIMSNMDELVHQMYQRRFGGEALLQTSGFRSFAQARVLEDSDTWDPMVVVCGPSAVGQDLSDLIDVASDSRTGTAIVAVGDHLQAHHVLHVSEGNCSSSLEMIGSIVFPQRIDADELAGIGALVDTASVRDSVSLAAHPYSAISIPMPEVHGAVEVTGEVGTESDGAVSVVGQSSRDDVNHEEIYVAVLGPVEISGGARPFTRAWARELVIYLAMHPNGASNDAWATALWPDRLMASSSLHSTASVARRSLGQARDGQDHLPRAHGRLVLARSVDTDWARFVKLADANDLDRWRQALELVRGRPFDGLRASDWPILEGIAPAIEASVVDLSGRLAGALLRRGDAAGAERAARKGLLVSPYDERLYRMLLRAADLAGNPAGVESVMSELIRLVADDVEPFDSVHPSTMELYRSLTRRKTLMTAPR